MSGLKADCGWRSQEPSWQGRTVSRWHACPPLQRGAAVATPTLEGGSPQARPLPGGPRSQKEGCTEELVEALRAAEGGGRQGLGPVCLSRGLKMAAEEWAGEHRTTPGGQEPGGLWVYLGRLPDGRWGHDPDRAWPAQPWGAPADLGESRRPEPNARQQRLLPQPPPSHLHLMPVGGVEDQRGWY